MAWMNAHSAARRENDTTGFGVNWMKTLVLGFMFDKQKRHLAKKRKY